MQTTNGLVEMKQNEINLKNRTKGNKKKWNRIKQNKME